MNNFYKEIVEQMYLQHSLDKISPGDTRHFAIINMFLQGFNVLSIARLVDKQLYNMRQTIILTPNYLPNHMYTDLLKL